MPPRPHGAAVAHAVSPLAMVAVAALAFSAADAAFHATTANPGSTWTAGRISLSDDDTNSAMFTLSNLKPGDSVTKCIVVTSPSTQTYTSAVRIYATNVLTPTKGLDSAVTLTIDEGTGGSFTSCTGFTSSGTDFTGALSTFTATRTDYASGVTTSFSPSGGTQQTRTFRLTFTLKPAAPDSAQAGTAGTAITWEAR